MNFSYETELTGLKTLNQTSTSEEDVKAVMIEPVLREVLGYSTMSIQRENQKNALRPDFLCLTARGDLDLIVEAKALGVNLDKRPSKSDPASRIPKIQLEEYLRKRPDAGHGVYGLLSNGEEWRVCQRRDSDVIWLSSAVAKNQSMLLQALNPLVNRSQLPKEAKQYSTERGKELLELISTSSDHENLLSKLTDNVQYIERHTDLVSSVRIERSQHDEEQSDLLFEDCYFATIGSYANDGILAVADIFNALKGTYLGTSTIKVCGIGMVSNGTSEGTKTCRAYLWDGKALHTSNSFDPDMPGTRVLRQLEMLARWIDGKSSELVTHLNSRVVHGEFYDELASWFKRTGTELKDLRHLIRVLFSWFLKEHGVIPIELFEKHADINIHQQMEHLFTHTLSIEPHQRMEPNHLSVLRSAYQEVPFLNGSLFNEDPILLRSELSDKDYLKAGESEPGLFTILKRYEWTLTEHDQLQSDTALDPSMIGSVFERFVALAEKIKPGPLAKQPHGTYYTPKDLTDEMVCDALAHDVSRNVEGLTFEDALNLLHPKEGDFRDRPFFQCQEIRKRLIERLRKVTILDPCTGSGEFIVSVLNTLRRAEQRLDECYDDLDRIKAAIANQLFAVDIHPIAIQVTRFRFYLALIGTQLTLHPNKPLTQFPNLETRITTANSLATRLRDGDQNIQDADHVEKIVQEWRNIRDSYTFAHNPIEKEKVRSRESKVRRKLLEQLSFTFPQVQQWMQEETLGNERLVAQCGLTWLFGKENWDIVIGNPPYQSPSSDEKLLAATYGYRTSSCGDLFCLFVELGVNLVGERGGLTMVVPHSLCFSNQKQKLRDLCNENANVINIRTYNNSPQPVFPPHPFIKGGNQASSNRQRVSVFSLLAGKPKRGGGDLCFLLHWLGWEQEKGNSSLQAILSAT